MTPTRLCECLDALRWSQRDLAAALSCNEGAPTQGRTSQPRGTVEPNRPRLRASGMGLGYGVGQDHWS
jgi:hypothetical protein